MKRRLDSHLCDEGFFESRVMAQAAIMEGLVTVEGKNTVKPGTQVTGIERISVSARGDRYVSRGGIKLDHALDEFRIDLTGLVALDVGASTGGFTECLLRRGAAGVIALDVGKGQLHMKLREDPRVTVLEKLNARYLKPADLPAEPSMATVDVSFISLTMVMEPVFGVLSEGGEAVALVKPQFEAGRKHISKGGVVRDPAAHLEVLLNLEGWLEARGLRITGLTASPLMGPKGNIEFFARVAVCAGVRLGGEEIAAEVEKAHLEKQRGSGG